mgnify:CR=1 FL=1
MRSTAVLTLLLAAQACARGPTAENATQENVINGQTRAVDAVRASQDHAAAMADAAVQETSKTNPSEMVTPGGYPPLLQGQPVQAEALVDAILRMARTFESPGDMLPENVANVTALSISKDAQGKRTGVQGAVGSGTYEFAVWKPYERHPGHTIELTVQPDASCSLSFKSLHDPLVAAGFAVTRSAPRFKPLVYFERVIPGGLGFYVVLGTDAHNDPRCVTQVTLDMEPRDGTRM